MKHQLDTEKTNYQNQLDQTKNESRIEISKLKNVNIRLIKNNSELQNRNELQKQNFENKIKSMENSLLELQSNHVRDMEDLQSKVKSAIEQRDIVII